MILSIKNLSCFTDVEHDRKPIEFLFVMNDRRRTKMFSYDKMSRCSFLSNKWLLLVVSCSVLDEGFIKVHEKLREEMKEPRVWVGAWLGERCQDPLG